LLTSVKLPGGKSKLTSAFWFRHHGHSSKSLFPSTQNKNTSSGRRGVLSLTLSYLPEIISAGIGTLDFHQVAEVSSGRSLHLSG
jgi:hypothetical protein